MLKTLLHVRSSCIIKTIIYELLCFNFVSDCVGYLSWLNHLLTTTEPLTKVKNETNLYVAKYEDLLKNLEATMETFYTYDNLYKNVNNSYAIFSQEREEIDGLLTDVTESIDDGATLVEESKTCLIDNSNNLQVDYLI